MWLDLRPAVRSAVTRPAADVAVCAIPGCSIAAATVLGAVLEVIAGDAASAARDAGPAAASTTAAPMMLEVSIRSFCCEPSDGTHQSRHSDT
jgi:hypothetical protein